MATAYQVADFFVRRAQREPKTKISHLKLQKLVYYAQGYSLALLGRELFPERIEAWTHGPVVVDLYRRFRSFGSGTIAPGAERSAPLRPDEEAIAERVYLEKGRYTGWQLRQATHEETPWRSVYGGWNELISTGSMRDYFSRVL